MDNTENKNTSPTEKKEGSLVSRILTATAFGALLATKVNNIGTIIDANNILKGNGYTFKQKIGSVFSGELFGKLADKYKETVKAQTRHPVSSHIVAGTKIFRYTIITGAIGAAIGGALGWTLGGRIENWKDIFKHPVQSTKIMFGIDKPDSHKNDTMVAENNSEQDISTKWQDYTKERQKNSQEIGKTV
jgi:hypothetical protein